MSMRMSFAFGLLVRIDAVELKVWHEDAADAWQKLDSLEKPRQTL
jgi:hypothetical protein